MNRKFITINLLLIALSFASCTNESSDMSFNDELEYKVGNSGKESNYINEQAKEVLKENTILDNAQGDYDLYPVEIDGKYGYINKLGVLIILPWYELANNFIEDLAL